MNGAAGMISVNPLTNTKLSSVDKKYFYRMFYYWLQNDIILCT